MEGEKERKFFDQREYFHEWSDDVLKEKIAGYEKLIASNVGGLYGHETDDEMKERIKELEAELEKRKEQKEK